MSQLDQDPDFTLEWPPELFEAELRRLVVRRSAIVTLAGILELRKALLKDNLTRRDESDLFEIANRFDLRHRNDSQLVDYDDNFLEWIFYWYLATVDLTEKLIAART
jgi:hypothetical protein